MKSVWRDLTDGGDATVLAVGITFRIAHDYFKRLRPRILLRAQRQYRQLIVALLDPHRTPAKFILIQTPAPKVFLVNEALGTEVLRRAWRMYVTELIREDGGVFYFLHAAAEEDSAIGSRGCCQQTEDYGRVGATWGMFSPLHYCLGGGGGMQAGCLKGE